MFYRKIISAVLLGLLLGVSVPLMAKADGEKKNETVQGKAGKDVDKDGITPQKSDFLNRGDKPAVEFPLARMIVGALTVFGLLVVAVVLLKKYGGKLGVGNLSNIITIKARQQLDQKNSLVVAKVFEDEYVLGVGQNGVTLLAKLMPIQNSEIVGGESDQFNNEPFETQLNEMINRGAEVQLSGGYNKRGKTSGR